jgi:hypothetical protein
MMNTSTLRDPAQKAATELFVLVFRTDIRFKKDLKTITPALDQHPLITKWNVDMDDTDRILRIVSSESNPEEFISIVKQAGFFCEELND